jgi:4a-hydroxytetrahydrobiopterin dehydratase
LLSPGQVADALAELPDWLSANGKALTLELETAGFVQAMAFLNAVAYVAESQDHHPDMLIHGYKHVRIILASHDAGGITERDLRLAASISSLLAQ